MSIAELIDRPNWMNDANCRGLNSEVFFPARGADTTAMKAICRECDVQAECLTFAINNGEKFGIWGGKSERERRAIRRRYGIKAADEAAA